MAWQRLIVSIKGEDEPIEIETNARDWASISLRRHADHRCPVPGHPQCPGPDRALRSRSTMTPSSKCSMGYRKRRTRGPTTSWTLSQTDRLGRAAVSLAIGYGGSWLDWLEDPRALITAVEVVEEINAELRRRR